MRPRMLLILAVGCSLSLTGCITINTGPVATPSASTPPVASVAPTPEPEPVAAPEMTITLDGIVYSHDNTTALYPTINCQKIVDLFNTVSEVTPLAKDVRGYYDPNVVYATRYDWGYAFVDVPVDASPCTFRVNAADMNGVPMKTEEGISVGSTQANVVSAGGWATRAGFTDEYGLSSREVPGTKSLMKSGAVGIDYLGLFMEDGKVGQIVVTTNDYADL